MPILNPRYNNTKVWRPKGTKYVEEEVGYSFVKPATMAAVSAHITMSSVAIDLAYRKFFREFGYWPISDRSVVELSHGQGKVMCTLFEIPEGNTNENK